MVKFYGIILISLLIGSSNGERKITGGSKVNITDVPYMASIEFLSRFACPGVIIAPRWIATSAICMDLIYPEDIVVRTGATEYETGGHLYPVQDVIRHPKYGNTGTAYDIALVQLALDITMNTETRVVPITTREPAPGTLARVSGWGSILDGSIKHRAMMSVELPIYDRTLCNERYSFDVTELWICTLKEGAGPCNYDEGDPLVVAGSLVGIKAWILQEQCGDVNRPSPYVNLVNPEIRDFIRNTTGI